MSNEIEIIRAGESLPFTFDLDGASIDGYVLTISVKQFGADVSAITPRIITPTGTTWTGFLTSTETASLTVNTTYRLIGTAVKSSTGEEVQFIDDNRFTVTAAWG